MQNSFGLSTTRPCLTTNLPMRSFCWFLCSLLRHIFSLLLVSQLLDSIAVAVSKALHHAPTLSPLCSAFFCHSRALCTKLVCYPSSFKLGHLRYSR